MRILTEPRVYLMSRQILDPHELRRFAADEGVDLSCDAPSPAEKLIEFAGRLCYMSFNNRRPGGNVAYLQHLLEVGHGSVLEHAVWTFVLCDVSRSLTHELIRHRAGWAYSEQSQRYVDMEDSNVVAPPAAIDKPGILWEVRDLAEQARKEYARIVAKLENHYAGMGKTEARKAARQTARSVLGESTETRIVVTANARSLRHFFEMRASRHADAEIRRVAVVMWKKLVDEAPNLFGDYSQVELDDGSIALDTKWRKV